MRAGAVNPYQLAGKGAGQKGGQRNQQINDRDEGDGTTRKHRGNFVAVYPVEPQTKEMVMQWIQNYLTKRKVDSNSIEWQQGPIEGKVAIATIQGKPGRVFNCLAELKEPFPEDRKKTNYLFSPADLTTKLRLKQFAERGIPGPLFENGVLNLSDLGAQLGQPPIDFVKNPIPLEFLMFLCAVQCAERGLLVHSLKCENNELTSTRSFMAARRFFPDLRRVSLSGNNTTPIQKDQRWKNCFGDVEVSFEGIGDLDATGEYRGWGSRVVYETGPLPVTIQHTLPEIGTPIERQEPRETPLTLDSFPALHFDVRSSRLNLFLASLFEIGNKNMRDIGQFYWPSAVFSITLDSCSPTSQMARVFSEFDGNLLYAKEDQVHVVVGREQIVAKFFDLFRSGFYARPTTMAVSVKAHAIGSFLIRGVFTLSFDEKSVLGFHRTLVILEAGDGYAILNEHLFIHEI
jgi:hypothetical protein